MTILCILTFYSSHKPVKILFFGLQEVDCMFDGLGHENTDIKRVLWREMWAREMKIPEDAIKSEATAGVQHNDHYLVGHTVCKPFAAVPDIKLWRLHPYPSHQQGKNLWSTYHNWLTEILVHCCSPQGGEVNTVEGGLVPEGQRREPHFEFLFNLNACWQPNLLQNLSRKPHTVNFKKWRAINRSRH